MTENVSVYATAGSNNSRTLHVDEDCTRLQEAERRADDRPYSYATTEVDLDAFPPAWRDWCGTCAPDGLDSISDDGREVDA